MHSPLPFLFRICYKMGKKKPKRAAYAKPPALQKGSSHMKRHRLCSACFFFVANIKINNMCAVKSGSSDKEWFIAFYINVSCIHFKLLFRKCAQNLHTVNHVLFFFIIKYIYILYQFNTKCFRKFLNECTNEPFDAFDIIIISQ